MMDLKFVRDQPTPSATAAAQKFAYATGTGSLEASRGTIHSQDEAGASLTGETDAFGGAWDGRRWSGQTWTGTTWTGGSFTGSAFTGGTWNGRMWSGRRWSSGSWTGRRWSGSAWTGRDLDRPDVVGQRLVRPQMVRRGVDLAGGHDDHAAAPGIARGGRRFRWASDLAIQGVWERTGWGRWP